MPEIRQHDHYSLRNTIRAGCIQELWYFFNELGKGLGVEELRRKLAEGDIFSHFAYSTRMALWKIFRTRYLNISDPWVHAELIRASRYGPDAPEFISLLYLYFILRDKLAFEFVVNALWGKWLARDLSIGSGDVSAFYLQLDENNNIFAKITAESKGKLIRNTVSTLQDFGLVAGKKHRVMTRPPVVSRTAFHLVRLLAHEGLSGKQIVESPDWRIFLWDQQDVSKMLVRLAREKQIRYEKSGNTVILEILKESIAESGA
jgi:hypothetical protein